MYSKINAKVYNPTTLSSLFNLIETLSNYKFIAGGTDLIVKIKQKEIKCSNLILLKNMKELKKIESFNDHIFIGAANTFSELLKNENIANFTSLIQSFKSIGSPQIRNIATIGGNIVNASPAADSVPALMLYNSQVVIFGKNSKKEIFLKDFFKSSYLVKLRKDEIVTGIKVFKHNFKKAEFIKIGKRNSLSISRLNIAYGISFSNQWRICLGSVTPFPVRMPITEKLFTSSTVTKESIMASIKQDILKYTDYRPSFDYILPVIRDILYKKYLG